MASASSISRRLRSRIAGESAWPTVVIPSAAPASAAISSKNSASTPGQSSANLAAFSGHGERLRRTSFYAHEDAAGAPSDAARHPSIKPFVG